MSRGASAIYVGTPAPTALIAGERPELVLTSSDYEVTLRASAKGERVLTLGPCIIIPLPIIPILFLNQTSNENLKLHGTISSLKGQDFKLSKVGATVGANKFEQLDLIDNKTTYENTKKNSSDLGGNDKPLSIKQQKITFNAIVPLSIQSVENIDVDIQLTEGQKDIVIPSIHLHSSSGTVWAICVM